MRILYIASVRMPDTKAAGLAIIRQCVAMADIGHEVTLLIPKRHNKIKTDLFEYYKVKKNITVKYYPTVDLMRFWSQGFYVVRLSEIVFSFAYVLLGTRKTDVIYSRDQWMLMFPVLLGMKDKCVFEVHTKHTHEVIKLVLKKVRSVVAISVGLKDFYQSLCGRADIVLAPSGVELDQFTEAPKKEVARTELKLPAQDIILGYVGKYLTMGESKGVDEIVEAFTQVFAQNPRLHLLIAGLEPYEIEVLKKVASEKGLADTAYTLRDLQPNQFSLYLVASDILLMNYPKVEHYTYYMSPTKLFAYLASGNPIISSDLPSVRSVAEDDVVTYVAPDSVEEFKKGIERVVAKLEYLRSFSEKRKELAGQYEWKTRAKKILGHA